MKSKLTFAVCRITPCLISLMLVGKEKGVSRDLGRPEK